MTIAVSDTAAELPARRGGAKALLLTVLGEFVRPAGGSVWTSTLLRAAATLGIGEKNARQAIARIADQGLVVSERHGRSARLSLTASGHDLLETGAERIYRFGRADIEWQGEWLTAHCPVPESRRSLRHRLRSELAFVGFGELSASLVVSPHVDREPDLRRMIGDIGIASECTIMRARTASPSEDAGIVSRAWSLDDLADAYEGFIRLHADRVVDDDEAFRAIVELVDDWRRFPFIDPELPADLLPVGWVGADAAEVFHARRAAWSPSATAWFDSSD